MYALPNLNHLELLLTNGLISSWDRGGSREGSGERSPKGLQGRFWA